MTALDQKWPVAIQKLTAEAIGEIMDRYLTELRELKENFDNFDVDPDAGYQTQKDITYIEGLRAELQTAIDNPISLNSCRVDYSLSTIFVALPKALHRPAGIRPAGMGGGHCTCGHPKCTDAWDTLAVALPTDDAKTSTTWTVHRPEGQDGH